MISEAREKFNAGFSPEKYARLVSELETRYETPISFRIAETPVFVPPALKARLIAAGEEIISFLKAPGLKKLTDRAIPPGNYVGHETDHPLFLAIDFAIAADAQGNPVPQLIELQGFPSLYAYQDELARTYREVYGIDNHYTCLFNNLSPEGYTGKLTSAILGDCDPAEVIMLDIDPPNQNTFIDFKVTQALTGVKPVGLENIILRNKKIFYRDQGREIPVSRIYNRVIFDELEKRSDLDFTFHLCEDADVQWAGHPNWFYRISKFIMPYLKGPHIPPSWFLDELPEIPEDLENYVLKPLYSFSGAGVHFNLNKDILSTIIVKNNFILQKKVTYLPVIKSPDGMVKTEIRLLYLWDKDSESPLLVSNLCRLSKGEMIGVKFNKNKTWVGGSVALFE